MTTSYTVLPGEATAREESKLPIEEEKATAALTTEEIAAQLEKIFTTLTNTQTNNDRPPEEPIDHEEELWLLQQKSITKKLKKQIEEISRPLTITAAKAEIEYLYNFYKEREELFVAPKEAGLQGAVCGGVITSSALILGALSCWLLAPSSSVAASLCMPTATAGFGAGVAAGCMAPVFSLQQANLFRLQSALGEIRKLENQLALQTPSYFLSASMQTTLFASFSPRMASMPIPPTPNQSPRAQQ